MLRRVLILTAFLIGLWPCELQAVVNSKWVGGEQGEWANASNWNPSVVPDNNPFNTFAVTIDAGAGEVSLGLEQDRTIDQLDCYGEVNLENWAGPWERQVELGTLYGLTNHGELWIGHNIFIEGDVFNLAGSLTGFTAGTHDIDNGDLDNAGFMTVDPQSLLTVEHTLHNAGRINVYGGTFGAEILDNNSTCVTRGFGLAYGHDLFDNKGQICAFGGSLILLSVRGPVLNSGLLRNEPVASLSIKPAVESEPTPDVNNFGRIEVNSGGGIAFDCNLVNEPGGVIELLGGTLAAEAITQKAEATFEGQGDVAADLLIEPGGLISLTRPTNIFGSVQIDRSATLEISDGTTLITGYTTCNGTIHMKGGRIIPQGGLSGECNIIWEPGTYSNVADFNLDGRVDFKDFTDFADTWLWQADWHAP